jgi:fibronectin type 3 domain-containing protein
MKTLPSIVFSLLIVLAATAQSLVPPKVTLAWDQEPATNNVAYYKNYWGVATHTYTNSIQTGTNTTGTVSNLAWSTTYFFASTAIGTNGLESTYSNEVSTNTPPMPQFPPPPPTTLRIITVN